MELTEDWFDVFSGACSGEETGGRVLNDLQFVDDFFGGAIEDAIAEVESGGDESVYECFSSSA